MAKILNCKKAFFLFICLAVALFYNQAAAQAEPTLDENTWVTNGSVQVSTINGSSAYIGGGFTYVGPYTGNGAPLYTGNGSTVPSFPKVSGSVSAVLPDGSGGWYIAGDFDKVGSVSRNRMAHILSGGSVDTGWNPNVDAQIFSMAYSPDHSLLYIGGNFTNVGGQTRQYLASVSTATGAVTSWIADADGAVTSIAPTGTLVYIGGAFTHVSSSARNFLAAVDASTGDVVSWDPSANGQVNSLQLSADGQTIYMAGSFSMIGSDTRNYIAAIDATTATSTSWDPNSNNTIQTIFRSGDTIYAGGSFTSIGGESRNYIAALDATTGNATAWDPGADSTVDTIAAHGSSIYVGGGFTYIGGQTRNFIAALDASTGSATAWDPNASSNVSALATNGDGSQVYAGGDFNSINGAYRNYIAEVNLDTGAATAWNPNADNTVTAMVLDTTNSKLYVGGSFTNIGGASRNRIAALNLSSGNATAWDPGANNTVNVLGLSADKQTIYAGGSFTSLGGESRSYLGAVDAATAAATSWSPLVNHQVYDFVINSSQSLVYTAAGAVICRLPILTSLSLPRLPILPILPIGPIRYPRPPFPDPIRCRYYGDADAYQISDGENLWHFDANERILTVALSADESTLYLGGNFYSFGGESRNRLVALTSINTASPVISPWNPDAEAYVNKIRVSPSDAMIYVGGGFSMISSTARSYAAALSADGTVGSWDPSPDNAVLSLVFNSSGSKMLMGGDYLNIGTTPRPYFAGYTLPLPPSSPAPVYGGGLPAGALSTPANAGLSVKINGDSPQTGNAKVVLTISANDTVTKMAVSNYADFHDAGIEPLATSKDWDLCQLDNTDKTSGCPSGARNVYVKFYTAWGQSSAAVSDSIILSAAGAAANGGATSGIAGQAGQMEQPGVYLTFLRDRALGSKGDDIKLLQHFLNMNGFTVAASGPGSLGNETTFFGRATFNALSKFQRAYKTNIGISATNTGIGRLGPMTRRFINSQKILLETTDVCSPPSSWCW
jgi:trimeric autotransporter adhesin